MRNMSKILVVAAVLGAASTAVSQTRERVSDQLGLARICASEAGLPERDAEDRDGDGDRSEFVFSDDCAAIHSSLSFGADQTDMQFISFARAYSRRLFDTSRTGGRSWLVFLNPQGSEPANWPAERYVPQRDGSVRIERHAPWSAYREAWMALYEHAGRIVRGEVDDRCESTVSDWGGSMDRNRANRLGLIPVSCGHTHNDFYIRPSWAADVD
jgi:hypothetical protein